MVDAAEDFELIERNLRHAMHAFSRCHLRGEARSLPGVVAVSSGYNYPLFNSALLTEPVNSDLESRIDAAAGFFRTLDFGWAFWVCEDLLDPPSRRSLRESFVRRGFRPIVDAPGMIARWIIPPRKRLPVLDYAEVCDSETRSTFCHLISVTFQIDFQTCLDVYGGDGIWRSGYRAFLGYAGVRAISAAILVATGEVAGLYSVATTPELQGMGYGEATVRHVIHRAQHDLGVKVFILQSTRSGLPLYRRLGFETVTRFFLFQK
jgi:GNAT superfamily N-acetyltransferase